MSRALFVYWKIDGAALPQALTQVRAAQARLRDDHPGLVTGLWCRDDPTTVMETYAAPTGIAAATEAQIEATLALALAGLPAGPRHVEVFRPA